MTGRRPLKPSQKRKDPNLVPLPPPTRKVYAGFRSIRCILGFHKLENIEPDKEFFERYKCVRKGCDHETKVEYWHAPPMPPVTEKYIECLCPECGKKHKVLDSCPVAKCLVRINGRCSFWREGKCKFVG